MGRYGRNQKTLTARICPRCEVLRMNKYFTDRNKIYKQTYCNFCRAEIAREYRARRARARAVAKPE